MDSTMERAPAGTDFLKLLATAVADELEARLPDMIGRTKELWTAEELAERYNLSPASVRRRIQAGGVWRGGPGGRPHQAGDAGRRASLRGSPHRPRVHAAWNYLSSPAEKEPGEPRPHLKGGTP